ncbi:MAG: histidine phosphatase family protein [Lachnospiraceae bacterium]|nr:histidine phosphatase family protein [Lachnospiraceae bacterium]
MRLILVRHGDPNYEQDCLTELGHKQAKVVAERLMEEGIEEIYCSPQGRAQQTAKPFAELSGIEEIHTLDFMREIRFGSPENLYMEGNPWLCSFGLMHKGVDLQDPGWREFSDFVNNTATVDVGTVQAGVDGWLETLGYKREGLYYRCTNETDEKRTIVLFSHGGSSTALLSRVFNIPFPHMCVMFGHVPHTCITSLRFDRKPGVLSMPILEYSVDARHLNTFKEGVTGSVERAQS